MSEPWEREMEIGTPRLITVLKDRIAYRAISETDSVLGWNLWATSDPVPLQKILSFQEIYFNVLLILGTTSDGKYAVVRMDDWRTSTIVHTHNTPIYGIFYVDQGHALFSADDGWWATTNTGYDWGQVSENGPAAKAAVVVGDRDILGYHIVNAYGNDKKLWYWEYGKNGSIWTETFDTTSIWGGEWYPALDGAQVGILAGAGPYILISESIGLKWTLKQTVKGIVRKITVSSNSKTPSFYVIVSSSGDVPDKLYLTKDLGASLLLQFNRTEASINAESVFPTGEGTRETNYIIMHQENDAQTKYKLLKVPDSD